MDEAGEQKSTISNTEWGMVIGFVGVIDLAQMGIEALDLTGFGAIASIILNRLIDVATGLGLFMYFKLRGVRMTPARTISLLLGFAIELIPVVDIAPAWTLDVLYIMLSVKAEDGTLGGFGGMLAGFAAGALEGKFNPTEGEAPKTLPKTTPPPLPQGAGATLPPIPGSARTSPPTLPSRGAASPIGAPTGTQGVSVPPPLPAQTAQTGRFQGTPQAAPTTRSGPEFVGRTFEHDQALAGQQGVTAQPGNGGVKTYEEWAAQQPGIKKSGSGERPPTVPGMQTPENLPPSLGVADDKKAEEKWASYNRENRAWRASEQASEQETGRFYEKYKALANQGVPTDEAIRRADINVDRKGKITTSSDRRKENSQKWAKEWGGV